jgi:hypothetical protein
MKIIYRLSNGAIMNAFPDSYQITQLETLTRVISPAGVDGNIDLAHVTAENSAIASAITTPSDLVGDKYLYQGGAVVLNPDYVEPEEEGE